MVALQRARDDALAWKPEAEQEGPRIHVVYARRRMSTYEVSEGFLRRMADWRAPLGVGLIVGGGLTFVFKPELLNAPMPLTGIVLLLWFAWRHRNHPWIVRKGPDVIV